MNWDLIKRLTMQSVVVMGALAFGLSAWAQTKEQLHPSNPDFEKDRIHAKGVYPSPDSFLETYAPPKALAKDSQYFDNLFAYVSWFTFFYFLLMLWGVLYFSIKYKEKKGLKGGYYTDGKKEKKYTLIIDILFFITLDCVLIYYSVVDTKKYFMNPPTGNDVVRIQVMPQQWVWNFRYAGNDGIFGTADDIVTTNEMWIPKGKMAYVQLKSKDVIHGFMVPEVRRQMDALPGAITKIWFEPIRTGDFEIACMHLCGTAHYKMKGFMKVVEPDEFEFWFREMSEWSEARFDPEDRATHWGWTWAM
jgi:cytochrome c oxidase subunit 2